jgi:hypothetical protein
MPPARRGLRSGTYDPKRPFAEVLSCKLQSPQPFGQTFGVGLEQLRGEVEEDARLE